MPVLPSHGSVPNVDPANGNGTSQATYINNGDGALSDTFTVLDDQNGTIVFSVTVLPAAPSIIVSPSSLATASIGSAYSQSMTASGGTAPYTFAVSAGALPAGLTLSSSGTLSGTPTAGGTFNFTITATDQTALTGSRAYTMVISSATITIAPTTLPAATVATAYSQTVTASGGTAGYTYTISAGALPAGISLSSGGVLSGTPTAGGTFNFTVRATDSSTGTGPYVGTRAYALSVNAPTIALTPVSMPAMTVASSFSQNVVASGGTAPYTYSVSAGTLPTGVTLASNGTLSGTPTTAGPFNFTVTATDSTTGTGPYAGSRAYSVNVSPGLPIAGAVSATVSYNSSSNPITLNLSGGTAASVAVASAAAHGTAVASGIGISYTPITGYAGSDSFTYTATNLAGTSSPATVTITITQPTLTITPSTSWSAIDGNSYTQTLTWSGGNMPYSGFSASGLPPGLAMTATSADSLTISGTPTGAGSYSVTVSATDSSTGTGPFTKSQTFTLTVAAPTINLSPAGPTLTASYGNAFSQLFSASGGVAPYTFVLTGSLPAGLSWNAGSATLSGTPTQSGSFTVMIRATDSSTGVGAPFSTSRSYTLNVGAPNMTLTPSVIAGAKVNVAYSQQFTASGGIAPYTYMIAAGSLPAGLVLNATTGLLNGTPTISGNFAFTVRATDAHSFTAQQALTLTVAEAQPVVVNDSASTQANQAVTINVTANDIGPISSIAISTQPTHGSAIVNGLNIVYTPTANYFGSDSLSYIATGPGGTSTPATVTITVTPLAVPVPVVQRATTLAGQSVIVHAANGATGGPFTAVAIVSPPSSGTAVVNGTDIIYTPVVGTSGDIQFSYTLANVFGVSAPVTATIHVNPMPVAGTHSATIIAGAAVNVDLMAGATGGPFTEAALVSVSPTAAGTAVIRDIGTAGQASYQMTFTAASKFAGSAVITYTLSNAYATSAPGSVNVTVTPRHDMSTDPEVIGLLAAQADSARRFATAQLSNFTHRLESLHGDGWGRSGFGVSFAPQTASNRQPASDTAQWRNDDVDRLFGSPLQSQMRKIVWQQPSGAAQLGRGITAATGVVLSANEIKSVASGLPELPVRQDKEVQALSLWIGGAVDFGHQNVNGRQAGFRFRTDGISAGGDYHLNELATFGIGTGFSRDSSDIGSNGSKSTAESVVVAAYGSLRPAKSVFIDGVLGYGTLNFDATRYITDGGGFATGLRHGEQMFGAIASGMEYRGDGWLLSPYGRLELMRAKLNPYTETATGLNALTYFKQTVRTTSGTLGLRAEGQYVSGIGTWVPRARIEFRHRFEGADDATLAYADLATEGPAYIVRTTHQDIGNWSIGLGARLLMRDGLTFMIDYSSNINLGNGRSQSIMFSIAVPF